MQLIAYKMGKTEVSKKTLSKLLHICNTNTILQVKKEASHELVGLQNRLNTLKKFEKAVESSGLAKKVKDQYVAVTDKCAKSLETEIISLNEKFGHASKLDKRYLNRCLKSEGHDPIDDLRKT